MAFCFLILLFHIYSTINIIDATVLNFNGSSIINPNYLGIGANYQGFSFMPEAYSNGMNSTYHDIEFSRVCEARLKVARTWYGPNWAMTPVYDNSMATNIWNVQFDWESVLMNKFYSWLDQLRSCNIDVALAGSWWFTQNTCSPASPGTCMPTDNDIDIYTQFISQSLHQIINVRGFTNVKYLIYFTEPLDYESGKVPTNYTQLSYYAYVLDKLNQKLVADGTRKLIQIVGPNSNFSHVEQVINYKNNENQYVFSNILDIYSGHAYNFPNYNKWYDNIISATKFVSNSATKSYWMDEYGSGPESYRNTSDYGTYISFVNIAALNANASMTLNWAWEDIWFPWPLSNVTNGDSFYHGLHKWGHQYWLPYNTSVRPSYYAITLLTKYLSNGGVVLNSNMANSNGCIDNVAFAAVQNNTDVTVLITNQNQNMVNVSVNIYALQLSQEIKQLTLYRHLYDPANIPEDNQIIGVDKTFNCDVNTNGDVVFNDTLVLRGFAVYTTDD